MAILFLYLNALNLSKNHNVLSKGEQKITLFFGISATGLTTLILLLEAKDWTSFYWSVQALIILIIALKRNLLELRFVAYIIGVLTLGKLLAVDSNLRGLIIDDITGSIRFIMYVVAIIIFYLSGIYCNKYKGSFNEKRVAVAGYFIAATLLTTVLLALEFDKEYTSIAWALQAIVLLVVGFGFKKEKLFRQMGMVVFAIAIVKVFLIDFQELEVFF